LAAAPSDHAASAIHQSLIFIKNSEQSSVAQAPAEEVTANLRKRWVILLPAVFVTYSLAYLDRANYGFGAAAGLASTLHITDSQTALLGSLFFLGYFFFRCRASPMRGAGTPAS
jgi:Sugar phosphate permease